MTNVLLTDLGLSILPKFLFGSFIDKCVSTSVDLAILLTVQFLLIYIRISYFIDSTVHLLLIFELLSSSDPGHKKFWKRETGSMLSLRKTPERCA